MNKVVQNYILEEKIGSGQYGNVYKAQHKINAGLFAVKMLNTEKFNQTPKLMELINNQIKILTKLSHPGIIKFYEMFQKPNNYYLVYEFCNGGTLEEKIHSKIKIPQQQALDIFQQLRIAYGVLYESNILHRDLKPQNILFHNGKVKIADFGFCKQMLKEKDMAETMVGSPIYMAPQVMKGTFYDARADIWSLGVVLYQMLFGFCPYEQNSIPKLINSIDNNYIKFPYDTIISEPLRQYILRLLTINYKNRISASQFVATSVKTLKRQQLIVNDRQACKYIRSALIYLTQTLDIITEFADDLKYLRVSYMIYKIILSILKNTQSHSIYWDNLSLVNKVYQWDRILKEEQKLITPYGAITKEALQRHDASLKTKVQLQTLFVDLKYFLQCINKIPKVQLKQQLLNCFLYNKHFVLVLQKKPPQWIDPCSKTLSLQQKEVICKQYARYF